MRLSVTAVDYAPKEFEAAVPFSIRLLRMLPGPDRADYWLGEIESPFEVAFNNAQLTATYLVLAARWQGGQIAPLVENLPINMAVVMDESQLTEDRVDFSKSNFMAIGIAHEVEGGGSPKPRLTMLAGTIGRFFGKGHNQ